MARPDLLALTADDLALLANRGIVKRAQQELASGALSYSLSEDNRGSVDAHWSDGVECRLPAGKALGEARCSCPATTLCRHIVRSVLAYQRQVASTEVTPSQGAIESSPPPGATQATATRDPADAIPTEGAAETSGASAVAPAAPSARPWDPGAIDERALAAAVSRATLTRARRLFEAGQVVDLLRSAKPSARLHTVPCSVRFLVPGDLRYTHCDCAEPAPCSHVPVAVWAFRLLAPEQVAGLVSTRREPAVIPTRLLDDVETALRALAEVGIAGAPDPLIDRLRRLERRCRQEELVWPAEILADLASQHAAYATRDARFSPTRVADLVGELLVRCDAIRSDTGAVPSLFVRGSQADEGAAMGAARLIGLGCGARLWRGGVELAAYLHDAATGHVVTIGRDFVDPAPERNEDAKEFWRLAQTPIVTGAPLAEVGRGQLLAKGGKRTPGGRYNPGRAPVTVNPQAYAWESLRPPALVEDFAELRATLAARPPAALRPRRIAESIFVCRIERIEAAGFVPTEQAVRAVLEDAAGNRALLIHPYVSRGRAGTEALLGLLGRRPEAVRFVTGHVRLSASGPVVSPLALVYEDRAHREMLQPWVDRQDDVAADGILPASGTLSTPRDPLAVYRQSLLEALGELFLLGLAQADEAVLRSWRDLHRQGTSLGFARLLRPLAQLVAALDQKNRTLVWEAGDAITALLELASYSALVQDDVEGSS